MFFYLEFDLKYVNFSPPMKIMQNKKGVKK